MSNHTKFGEQIQSALTARQIAAVLDALVPEIMDVPGFLERLAKTEPDAARIVERMLTGENTDGVPDDQEPSLSKDKLLEIWSGLWAEWDDIASEVGDEDGRYAEQDAHWEPAYFDSSTLAEDLERVAGKMDLVLEEAVAHLDLPRELFFEALADLDSRVGGYPEWMGAEHGDPCGLGPETTSCILRWLWLHARDEDDPELRFLESFQTQLAGPMMFELDRRTCGEFFAYLPQEDARRIHARIRDGAFPVEEDSSRWTIWDQIRYELDQRFDPARYLATCRQKLATGWQYGLPLIEDAETKGDLEALETWLGKTFSSLLRTEEEWRPEDSLFVEHLYSLSDEQKEAVVRLFETWANTAQSTGKTARAAAARLQRAILADKRDIPAVITEHAALSGPETDQVLAPLFQAWKGHLAKLSWCARGYGMERDVSWVHWLVEAGRRGPDGRTYFSAKLHDWFTAMLAVAKLSHGDYECLQGLTFDLSDLVQLAHRYPGLASLLRIPSADTALHRSRKALLQELQAQDILDDILAVWRTHIAKMVPDPGSAKNSRYEKHAAWMRALHELDQSGYERVLAAWRSKHQRRRNLWGEMRSQGLPT